MTLANDRASRRKSEILAIARTLFAERGYASTSMRDLAEATGLLPGSLYAHFRSKADMARLVVMEFFDDMLVEQQAAFDADGSGATRFSLMIDRVFDACQRHHEAVRMLHYDWQVLSRLDELEEMRRATDRTLDMWRDVASDGVADGSIDPEIHPEYLMRIATSVVQGVMDPSRYQMRVAPTAPSSAVEQVKRCLLLGMTTPAGAEDVLRAAKPATKRTRKAPTSKARAKATRT